MYRKIKDSLKENLKKALLHLKAESLLIKSQVFFEENFKNPI